jgi:hypothetical protein
MPHDCQYMQFTIRQPTTMQVKNDDDDDEEEEED